MMEQTLGGFRDTKLKVESYNAYYDHTKQVWEDIGDLYTDENGEPLWAGWPYRSA